MKKVVVSILIALICITSVFAAHSKTANSVKIGDITIYESNDKAAIIPKNDTVKAVMEKNVIKAAVGVETEKANITEIVIGVGASDLPSGAKFLKWVEQDFCAAFIVTHASGERTVYFVTYDGVKCVFPEDCTKMFEFDKAHGQLTVQHIDLVNSDMSGVKKAEKLCNNLKALSDVDLPKGDDILGKDYSKDLVVKEMFKGCTSLETFDLAAVNFSAVAETRSMFERCSSLTTLYCDSATATKLSTIKADKMLEGCTSLAGTAYDKEDGTVVKSVGYNKNWKTMLADAANGGLFTNVEGISTVTMGIVLDGTIKVYFNVTNNPTLFNPNKLDFKYPLYSSYEKMIEEEITSFGDYNDGAFYRFTSDVAASQMGKDITFNLASTPAAGSTDNFNKSVTVSVKKLADKYIALAEDEKSPNPNLKTLCNAMLTYGALAQVYFGVDATNPVVANPTVSLTGLSFTGMTASPVYVYNGVEGSLPDVTEFGARFLGNSLLCYSDLRIRHSFKFADGLTWDDFIVTMSTHTETDETDTYVVDDAFFSLGVEDVPSQPGQKRYYIEVSDFPAAQFSKDYTVTMTSVADPTMYFSIKYSPMSYVNGAINNSDDAGLKNLCGGIYWFYKAADAYFNVAE